jgi:hypothetical protein
LFTALGFAVALLGRTRRRLAMAYVVVVTLVFLMAQWEAGFVFARINLPALVVALDRKISSRSQAGASDRAG